MTNHEARNGMKILSLKEKIAHPGDKSTKILKQSFFVIVTKSAKGPVGALLMSFDQPISSSIMINHTVRQTYSMKDG